MGQSTPARPTNPSTSSAGTSGGKKTAGPARAKKQQQPVKQGGTGILVAAAVAVVAIIVGVVVLFGGDDTKSTTADGTVLKEFQPVKVTGDKLPKAPDAGVVDKAKGLVAPQATGLDFASESKTLIESGQPTMIVFAAHWCSHCQKEIPLITSWIKDGESEGIDSVLVATGSDKTQGNWPPSAWLAEEGWPAKVIADDEAGTLANSYGLSGFPLVVFVDANGKVVGRSSGEQPIETYEALAQRTLGTTP